jgi:sialate O-acetylesterase
LCAALAFGFLTVSDLYADVKLPAIFSDHLVLQSGVAIPVWGWAEPDEEVTISVADRKATAKTGADGRWRVNLDSLKPGGPLTMTVQGRNSLKIDDVLVGEVWLGSGQSNMALTVNRANDFEKEKAAADLPQIRMFSVGSGSAESPQADCKGTWKVCSPDTVGTFSATLFFAGREIHRALGVPVGLIHSSVGGTPIEAWIDADAQHAVPELNGFFEAAKKAEKAFDPVAAKANYEKQHAAWQTAAEQARTEGKPVPAEPRDPTVNRQRKADVGGLFNGKIAPLIPYAIRGAFWYQGESNASPAKAPFYRYQLPLLVKDWRARWGYEFPIAWVQLPNYDAPANQWPLIREAMLLSLHEPKTGMAITIDIGEAKNIHPKDKQDVGQRLAMWALSTVYGKKDIASSGPLPAGHERRGSEMVLSFQHADGGLVAKGGELRGFTIAGADGQWKPAAARIDGEHVIVSAPDVPEPVAVRYAWETNPDVNFFNGAGLPASPFRTDTGN